MRRLIAAGAARRLIAAGAVLAIAVPVSAAERSVQVASFTRLRVEAPVEVTVVAGSPRASVQGDVRAAEWLDVRGDTGTLTIRLRPGGPPAADPLRVVLATPTLQAITAGGGARVTASGLKGPRIDLALAGAGSLAANGIDTDLLALLVAGNGTATLAGRAGAARMTISGAGSVDAAALAAGDLTLASDGAGETRARARYTATISNNGAGTVIVEGTPKCLIRPGSTGPIRCGASDRQDPSPAR